MVKWSERVRPWMAVVGVVTALVLGTAAVLLASSANQNSIAANDAADTVARLEVVQARVALETVLLDEVNLRVSEALDVAPTTSGAPPRRTALQEVFDAARRSLVELAGGGGVARLEAASILDVLDEFGITDVAAIGPGALYSAAIDAREAARPDRPALRIAAVHEVTVLAVIPNLILDEAMAAAALVADIDFDFDGDLAVFMEEGIEIVREDGGWLGAGRTPLQSAAHFDLDAARELFSSVLVEGSEILGEAGLVEVDRWVADIDRQAVDPPVALGVVVARTASANDELRAIVDRVITSEIERAQRIESSSDSQSTITWVAAAGIAAASIVLVAFGVLAGVAIIARTRRRSRLAALDALTQVGNRHHLVDRSTQVERTPELDHHLVVLIDLDRFKAVNDGFGHRAGDSMLIEIARHLDACARETVIWNPGSEHIVARLGGDEFLLSIHSATPIDADRVRRRVEEGRLSAIYGDDGTRLPIEFSVGTAATRGQLTSSGLNNLMATADAAVYADKAARGGGAETPPPT